MDRNGVPTEQVACINKNMKNSRKNQTGRSHVTRSQRYCVPVNHSPTNR